MSDAVVWFDVKGGDPERPWLIKRGDVVTRARAVQLFPKMGMVITSFKPDGHAECQPSGPRGVIVAGSAHGIDEVPLWPTIVPPAEGAP